MAIPNDMEQVNIIIESDFVKALMVYARSDGRRLSKSAAARELIIAALRAASFLPDRSVDRTPDSHREPAESVAA